MTAPEPTIRIEIDRDNAETIEIDDAMDFEVSELGHLVINYAPGSATHNTLVLPPGQWTGMTAIGLPRRDVKPPKKRHTPPTTDPRWANPYAKDPYTQSLGPYDR